MLDEIVGRYNSVQLGIEMLETGNSADVAMAKIYRKWLDWIMADLLTDERKVLERLQWLHGKIKNRLRESSEGWN